MSPGIYRRAALCLAAAGVLQFVTATAQAEALPDILARMDRVAGDFKSLSAALIRTDFTAVLNESADSEGMVRLKRGKNGTVGVVDLQKPEPETVYFNGREVQVFYPKANTVQIYDAGKYTGTIDQVLLIGFGTTGAELKKNYDIAAGSVETLGSTRATRIDLTPKSDELKKLITKIELWIPEGQTNPVQEKVTQPSKNYSLMKYSDLKINPPLPDSAFAMTLPAKVKKIHPQK